MGEAEPLSRLAQPGGPHLGGSSSSDSLTKEDGEFSAEEGSNMPNSIGGLASGLNTSDIINAILTGEQAARTRLVSRQSTYQRQLNVWQDLNTKLGSLRTASEALSTPAKAAAANATSSDTDLVTATAGSGATPSTFTFKVQQLAASHQLMANGFTDTTDLVGVGKAQVAAGLGGVGMTLDAYAGLGPGKYELEVKSISGGSATVIFNGKEQSVSSSGSVTLTDDAGNTADFTIATLKTGKASIGVVDTTASTTLAGLAGAINNLGVGVSAAAVNKKDGTATPTSFVLSARDPGTEHAVTMDFSNLAGVSGKTFGTLRAAADSRIVLADGTTTISRSSNRLTDVLPGVTIDLKAADASKEITVSVANDDDKLVQQAKTVVDALNSVLGAIKKSTSYDAGTKTAATMTGDSRMRRVQDSLLEAMRYSDTGQDKQVLAQLGISLRSDGTFALDETKFRAALANDHAGTVRLLAGDGAAKKGVFGTMAESVKNMVSSNGAVDSALDATRDNITALNDRISAEDQRLTLVENRVRRQYTNLESTMQQLNSQASGLASALG